MTLRRSFLWAASAALTVFLIVLLIKISKLDLRVTLQQLRSVSWLSFTKLVLLTTLHVYLSNLKWRRVDASLRHASDSAPSRTMSFALTSTGVALGQILPVQLSMSAARTLGTYFHGRALKRGTGGTLFEQAFDVLIVGFLAIASGVTRFYRGGGMMWTVCAVAMTGFAILAVAPAIQLIRRWVLSLNARSVAPRNRVLKSIAGLQQSGLLNPALARQLMGLSAARFAIQVLMAGQAAQAIGVHIPLWHFAAAMPFVIIACVIVVTPGGLGVNELSYATTLHLFGTPLNVGAQWALANRVLVALSCFVVAACGVALLGLTRTKTGIKPAGGRAEIMQED
jgi:uncharacterized membrane protein YbhN (UPF0104 family)